MSNPSGDSSRDKPGISAPMVKSSSSPPESRPSAALSFALSPEEEQSLRRQLEDKKFEQVQKINVLQCAKDFALAVDANGLPLEDLIRTIEARRARLLVEEGAVTAISDEVNQLAKKLRVLDPVQDGRLSQLLSLVDEAKIYLNAVDDWARAELAAVSRSRAASEVSCIQDIDGTNWQSTPTLPPRVPVGHESIVFRYSFVDPISLAGPTGDFLHAPVQPRPTTPLSAPPQVPIDLDRLMSPQTFGDQQQPHPAAQDSMPPQAQGDRQSPPQAAEDRERHLHAPRDSAFEPPAHAIFAAPAARATSHSSPNLPGHHDPLVAHDTLHVPDDVPPVTHHAGPAAEPQQQHSASSRTLGSFDQYSLGRKARQVPKFSGDTKKFREWEQLFRVFVDETPAPVIEKFNLLRTSLTGRAKDAISHLQWEESHYQIAKDILREKFGDSKLAQRSHIQELDNLVSKGIVTTARLEPFVESLALNIRALVALGVTFTELSTTTNQRVLRCLPLDLREKFIVKLAEYKLTEPQTTDLEFMLKFLESTVKVRREAEWDSNADSYRQGRRQFQPSRGHDSRYRNQREPNHHSARDNHSFFAAAQNRQQPSRQQNFTASRGRSTPSNRGSQNRRSPATSIRIHPASTTSAPVFPPVVSTQTANAPQTVNNAGSQNTNRSCIFCEGPHEGFRCNVVLSHAERVERIQRQNGCLKCLKRNHSNANCRDGPRTNCPACNGHHYLIMCPNSRADSSSFAGHIASSNALRDELCGAGPLEEPEILLQTAVVWVESGSSRTLARILLDTGAHRSYIAARTAQEIDSSPIAAIETSVKTLGNIVSTLDTCVHRITLRSRHDPSQAVTIEAIEAPEITNSILPEVSADLGLTPVADATRGDDSPRVLSIIVGAVDLAPIHTGVEKTVGRMMATSSIFGWLFSGTLSNTPATQNSVALLCQLHPALPVAIEPGVESGLDPPSFIHRNVCKSKSKKDESIENDLKFLWKGEFMGFETPGLEELDEISKSLSDFFDETTVRHPEGFHEFCLPLKDNLSNLGDNEGLARSRLRSLISKLRKKEGHLKAVVDEIRDNIRQGFSRKASPRSRGQLIRSRPLQAVFKYVVWRMALRDCLRLFLRSAVPHFVRRGGGRPTCSVGPILFRNVGAGCFGRTEGFKFTTSTALYGSRRKRRLEFRKGRIRQSFSNFKLRRRLSFKKLAVSPGSITNGSFGVSKCPHVIAEVLSNVHN